MQDQVIGPMIAAPPQQWPVEHGDETARLLAWLGTGGGSDATLEGALLMTLRFVAGADTQQAAWYPVRPCLALFALLEHLWSCQVLRAGRQTETHRSVRIMAQA